MKKYTARVGHSYTARLPEDWRGCSGRHVCFRIQRPQRTPAMRPTWPLHSLTAWTDDALKQYFVA